MKKIADDYQVERRQFLFSGLLMSTITVLSPSSWAAAPDNPWHSGRVAETFAAYLDTLIPADASPSASQLGINLQLLPLFQAPDARAWLIDNCEWLNAQARLAGSTAFASLGEPERTRILARMESLPVDDPRRQFFDLVRNLSFDHYYAHPASLVGMGLNPSPQPLGYPDYRQPPSPSPQR